MTEILDSAQEALPHLWVNGEKYIFSESVVDAGKILFDTLKELKQFITDFWGMISGKNFDPEKVQKLEERMIELLTRFDK